MGSLASKTHPACMSSFSFPLIKMSFLGRPFSSTPITSFPPNHLHYSKPSLHVLHHPPTSRFRSSTSRCTYTRLQHRPSKSRSRCTTKTHQMVAVRCSRRSGDQGEDDDKAAGCSSAALDAVLRLYSAIKTKDLHQLSDVIGDECRCISNIVDSAFKPLHGKHQVLDFFAALLKSMGDHLEFVIQPTMDDGLNVGLQWTLACSKTHKPFGKGFSFYTAHSYKGKLVIRNVEMFMEPILHIEPLRLRLIGVLSLAIAQVGLHKLYERSRKKNGYLLLAIVIIILASIFFLKHSLH